MILRKCINLLLVCLLLISNTGLAFNVHFCGESIASVSFKDNAVKAEASCCGPQAKVIKKNCCSDKVIRIKDKLDENLVKTFSLHSFVFPTTEMRFRAEPTEVTYKESQSDSYYCDANAPPLFKLYGQYIFYA